MLKKKFRFVFTPILLLGLAACNNNNDSAMGVGYPDANNSTLNQSNVDRSYVNQVNYHQDRLNREGPLAEDHNNNLFDHRGPLTENYIKPTPINHEQKNENSENRYSRRNHNQAIDNNQYARQEQNGRNQFGIKQQRENDTRTNETAPPQLAENISQYARQVVDLTNEQRRKYGLSDLQIDPRLNQVAQKKSIDMQQNEFFSHTSPTYGSSFDMLRASGVPYRKAGENIAQGQRTPEEVVKTWMNNEGQRRNILNQNFTHIGVGYEENGHYWTQLFIRK